jgi:hypothetical protein
MVPFESHGENSSVYANITGFHDDLRGVDEFEGRRYLVSGHMMEGW